MMLEAGLIVSRFLHDTAVLVLFGVSVFPFYAYSNQADEGPARLDHSLHSTLLGLSLVAVLTGLLWLSFTAANMAGRLSAAADWDALWSVLRDTSFGRVWIARSALWAVLVAVLIRPRRIFSRHSRWQALLVLVTTGLLASMAGVGHTQQSQGTEQLIHVSADALHLLAAGAWIGGLWVLVYIFAQSESYEPEDVKQILLRFSGMGYIAVAVLVASGLVNSWYLIGSISGLVATSYGQLLLVKLCLFGAMLGLAGANRFWLVPSLRTDVQSSQSASLRRLRRHVLAETTLGLLVVLIVGALGTMEPAIGQME